LFGEKYKEYEQLIKERLSEKRFVHSMNVAKAAVALTEQYGGDREKAWLCGVLHDIMKEEKTENLLQTMEQSVIMKDAVTLSARPLWHAKAGAIYCEQVLGITDRDILNAISYHTTGRAGMSHLEKILYLADYIGEERDYDDVDVMRKETYASMERGMRYALRYTINDLVNRGQAVHPDTVGAYNQLVLGLEK
jgi:nicotinate-nucleotide adenylyltransferase